jgi:hypothetical protein
MVVLEEYLAVVVEEEELPRVQEQVAREAQVVEVK